MSIENEITPDRQALTDQAASRAFSEVDSRAVLMSEEVSDDPFVEITPVKNMAAVGRIGMSSMSSIYMMQQRTD